jgi:hypothetical protein
VADAAGNAGAEDMHGSRLVQQEAGSFEAMPAWGDDGMEVEGRDGIGGKSCKKLL